MHVKNGAWQSFLPRFFVSGQPEWIPLQNAAFGAGAVPAVLAFFPESVEDLLPFRGKAARRGSRDSAGRAPAQRRENAGYTF